MASSVWSIIGAATLMEERNGDRYRLVITVNRDGIFMPTDDDAEKIKDAVLDWLAQQNAVCKNG